MKPTSASSQWAETFSSVPFEYGRQAAREAQKKKSASLK